MSDKRLKVLCPHTVIFPSDSGVFGTVAVQYSGFYFVEHDTWKFRTTSADGRVGGNILEFAKHLADRVDHFGAGKRSFLAFSHYKITLCECVTYINAQVKNTIEKCNYFDLRGGILTETATGPRASRFPSGLQRVVFLPILKFVRSQIKTVQTEPI